MSIPPNCANRRILSLSFCRNEALEICNIVFHILALDQKVKSDVTICKRNCLRLLQVREFAPEAMFKDLSRKVVLHDVTCKNCWYVADYDIARDSRIQGKCLRL